MAHDIKKMHTKSKYNEQNECRENVTWKFVKMYNKSVNIMTSKQINKAIQLRSENFTHQLHNIMTLCS